MYILAQHNTANRVNMQHSATLHCFQTLQHNETLHDSLLMHQQHWLRSLFYPQLFFLFYLSHSLFLNSPSHFFSYFFPFSLPPPLPRLPASNPFSLLFFLLPILFLSLIFIFLTSFFLPSSLSSSCYSSSFLFPYP